MIRIKIPFFFESFYKCQNYHAMFWKFRGRQMPQMPLPWLRTCSIQLIQGKLCFQGKRKLLKNPEW